MLESQGRYSLIQSSNKLGENGLVNGRLVNINVVVMAAFEEEMTKLLV